MGLGKAVVSDDEDEIYFDDNEGETMDNNAEQVDDIEDEEDEEGQDEYETDGFIVDDVEEEDEMEEEQMDDDGRHKKKKRRKRESEKNYVLDEDDYELLQDNNITGFNRPKTESKKFKRLKKVQNEYESTGLSDDDEFDESGRTSHTAEEKLKRSLFGNDEGAPLEDMAEEPQGEDGEIGEEDEMADFIVDEEEVDEHGAPLSRRKPTKKKYSQAPGVSSSALQEAHELFGDVDELLLRRKEGLDFSEWKERKVEDEFEPTVLSEKYMTEKDDIIRKIDIPERMQILEESVGAPPTGDMDIVEESNWIHKQLISGNFPLLGKNFAKDAGETQDGPINKNDIIKFLEFSHIQKLDIPFIALYRKEEIPSLVADPEHNEGDDIVVTENEKPRKLMWHKILWTVHDLDKKWLVLQKRKSVLTMYYNRRFEEEARRVYDETRLALNHQLFESIIESLKAADSEREVHDVDIKFNLNFPPVEVSLEGQMKLPKRKSHYAICSKSGLWEVSSKFGYSSEQFGLQISLLNMKIAELEDSKDTPEEMASNFTCALFATPQEVLKNARYMAAVEISCEPCVKKHVRSIFKNATISTIPTKDGNVVIDSFHQFSAVKWLKKKPLSMFKDAQWLLIQKAEEEKLLVVTIKLPEDILTKFLTDCEGFYLSNGVSRSAQLWNEQRKQILRDAVFEFLIPSMEKETRSLLTVQAKNWLLSEYGAALWEKVSVAPFEKKGNERSEEEPRPRALACCWGPGKPATTFVMLDSSGEVIDVLYAGFLTLRSQNIYDQQRKTNDQQRLLKFMTDHQPDIVVLGAANLQCTRLKDDIYEIIFQIIKDEREAGREIEPFDVVFGDESFARLYENSRVSSDQLPTHSGIVKRAVAMGRYIQNPLAMVATLCGPGKEILSWKIFPQENLLSSEEKNVMLEQVMVDVTNQVGVDINLAASHEWLFSSMQFISGIGPRKAASLQRSIARSGAIFSRKDLVTSHGLGKKVFFNSVGFLRVRRSGMASNSNHFIDLLDDTRIHPESYALAQQLAKDVYKAAISTEDDDEEEDEEDMEMAIEHVRANPGSLKSIDLNMYLTQKNYINKDNTFFAIRDEMVQGFCDLRKKFVQKSTEDDFHLITGETDETLAEGRVVQATVRKVLAQRAICTLELGMTGILLKEDYDDSTEISDLADRLREGDILTCKIKGVEKSRYQVFLVCKESEMQNNSNRNMDQFYEEDLSLLQSSTENFKRDKELTKKHFKSRMIIHPRFQNITASEAAEFLSDKDSGEIIIRPSSKGSSNLTLTLKVSDDVFAHKDIVEEGKELKDITSALRIGKILKIGDDTFEDLDEVMDRYVDPLVANLKLMLSHRKFIKGCKADVDNFLRAEKLKNPKRIVYGLGVCHEHPGAFVLTYIRSTNPHHELVGVVPKGFKFRKRVFDMIDRLINHFQKLVETHEIFTQSTPRLAAVVPMRSPAAAPENSETPFGSSPYNGGGSSSSWGTPSFDRSQSSSPGFRGGSNGYRNGANSNGGGAPRPYGERGRGGRGRDKDRSGGSGYSRERWTPSRKEEEGGERWSDFPGAKVLSSPGKGVFSSRWADGERGDGKGRSGSQDDWGGSWRSGADSNSGGGGGWDGGGSEVGEEGGWGGGKKSGGENGGWGAN